MGRLIEVLSSMAIHHLSQLCIQAEVQMHGSVFGILGTDLKVM
jgi:hypothetical protein